MNKLSHTIGMVSGIAIGAVAALSLNRGIEQAAMPNRQLTPGVTLLVTAEEVCVRGYAGKTRSVSEATKREVFRRYGITNPAHGQYEIDHLISLELGGSNAIENLWPQPYAGLWNAHLKDRLENKLHELVCDGTLTLAEAQREISTDWIEAYEKYISH